MLEWFYDESDRGEEHIVKCKNLYDTVENLQYRLDRLESIENDHMQLLSEMGKLQGRLDMIENNLDYE